MSFQPSDYQKRIFEFVETGSGNGRVDAVAGSGKTTTLVECLKKAQGRSIFVAFNKHIQQTLNDKLSDNPNAKAQTLHSVGLETLGMRGSAKLNLEEGKDKIRKLVKAAMDAKGMPSTQRKQLQDLVELSRLTLTDATPDKLVEMADLLTLEYQVPMIEMVAPIIEQSDAMAHEQGLIDYTDMLWLPHKWGLQPQKYDNVFVDEAQDLNAAQLEIALKLTDNGRLLFVGDEKQAIMAFAGADADSWGKIEVAAKTSSLPLSICYRCPSSHIELAQSIVPHIEPAPWAQRGTLQTVPEEAFLDKVREGDMVLCRRYAPLVSYCLTLIGQGRPATIRGRAIGRQLADVARRISKRKFEPGQDFLDLLHAWRAKEEAQLLKRDAPDSQFQHLDDQVACLTTCYVKFGRRRGEELARQIEDLFDENRKGIGMTSVHRAKGLEAERVWLLDYERLGTPFPKQNEREAEQERNLKYVALTRSKDSLFLVPMKQRRNGNAY